MSRLGIVAIGRNEGERLRRCLESLVGLGHAVVYVDSGSTDGSVGLARSLGAEVVELDLSVPFTAARARNAGFERLERVAPGVEMVQFVDGDCEVAAGWLERAPTRCSRDGPTSPSSPAAAASAIATRRIYNRLADLEWDTPIGEAAACGGDAMFRAEAFRRAGGYDPSIIAGEEPELCLRIRREGWKVLRIDAEMTVHDMAMTRFAQWWRRAVRGGHAYAEGAARHGGGPERHFVREVRSILFWGAGLPAAAAALAWPTWGLSLLVPAGGLSGPLRPDVAILPAGPWLARAGRPALRRVLRAGQIPPGDRRGQVPRGPHRGPAEPAHRIPGGRGRRGRPARPAIDLKPRDRRSPRRGRSRRPPSCPDLWPTNPPPPPCSRGNERTTGTSPP